MKLKEITLERCRPSIDIGRCEVCGKKPATRLLYIEHVHQHRFCDDCFAHLRRIVCGDADH